MKVWKLDLADDPGSPLVCDETGLSNDLLEELKAADVGSSYTVQVEEMSEEEFNKMPEWGGF